MNSLSHVYERELGVRARAATITSVLLDSERFARWWGSGSSIAGRVGGALRIRYPNGVIAGGDVLAVQAPRRFAFSYGYESGDPVALGATRVELELEAGERATRVRLRHLCGSERVRDLHIAGWRYQLGQLARVACELEHAELEPKLDAWFRAWNERDAAARLAQLELCTHPSIEFRDAHGCVDGIAELVAHIGLAQVHMRASRLERCGPAQQSHGTALVPWRALAADGSSLGEGTNALELAADGRLVRVVGLWR
jgi:uncharacterized protein YndB with AHSA1/START domain